MYVTPVRRTRVSSKPGTAKKRGSRWRRLEQHGLSGYHTTWTGDPYLAVNPDLYSETQRLHMAETGASSHRRTDCPAKAVTPRGWQSLSRRKSRFVYYHARTRTHKACTNRDFRGDRDRLPQIVRYLDSSCRGRSGFCLLEPLFFAVQIEISAGYYEYYRSLGIADPRSSCVRRLTMVRAADAPVSGLQSPLS